MKKLILAAALFVFAINAAMAANIENTYASSLVKKEFPGASNITAKENEDMITVNFMVNDQRMQAFYDKEGHKLGSSRAVQLQNLPLNAYKVITTKYADYTATEAVELNHEETGHHYYVSLQNETGKVILQVDDAGTVSIFKK
ncbi:hypothetical protein [Deminuibacter soli]|uniref:Beta-lactamase-inhibitor-like PepSY-like domain-containing protein n=1 Tax=Deminuibacter soli TaxID=2291815 RepID=A0A3E1NKY7_9BACT|nr:hypothetical protein [Deminuibacter soli]RFM28582.1 hypothetical protein DXN05_07225 [Deminuibacter soli]